MKLRRLLTIQQCPMKATFRNNDFTKSFDSSGQKNTLIKEIFTKDINGLEDLKLIDLDFLDNKFPDMLFESVKEKESYLKDVLTYVDTFMLKLNGLEGWTLIKKIEDEVEIAGETISVSIDMAFESDASVQLVNVKISSAKLKERGQKEDTKIKYSLELYLMYLLGKKLFPGKQIISNIAYLKESLDSRNYIASRNGITSDEQDYFETKVKSLLSTSEFEENCNDSNCMMCEFKAICNYTHSLEKPEENEEIAVDIDPSNLPSISYTGEQQDVINFKEGIAIANAVAGSGKTATVTKRLACLINDDKVAPEDILILSFSENTIDEFKEKLKKHHGITDFENIFTFHGFGDKVISDHYSLFGYKTKPRIINQVEKMDIIKNVIDSSLELSELNDIQTMWHTRKCILTNINYSQIFMRIGKNLGLAFKLEQIFNKIKTKGLNYSKDEFITEEIGDFEKDVDSNENLSDNDKDYIVFKYEAFLGKIYDMFESYSYILKSQGLYDYTDQINYLVYSITHPRLKGTFNYKHIVCDEFQDSNNLAMYVLRRLTLCPDFKSLLVVGDINQAIYGFLGTTPENLLTFENRFNDKVEIFDLSYSFRVPHVVSNASNALMNDSFKVKYNQMRSFRDEEGTLSSLSGMNDVINVIKENIANNKTVGILATTNNDLNIFISELINNNISYVVKSNLDIMKKDKVANLLYLSKFLSNPDNNMLEYVKYLQIADYTEFMKNFKTSNFNKYLEDKFNEILDKIDLKNPVELLDIYFELLSELAAKDYMIETFMNHMKSKRFRSIYDINDYCKKINLYGIDIKAKGLDVESNVVITTAHSSKGREFDTVIMDTSTFKSAEEEDRRLFYVAMTRTKENLYFVDVERKGQRKKDCSRYLMPIKASLGITF